jgi:hypothetical protein
MRVKNPPGYGRVGSHLTMGQPALRVIHPFNACHACTTTEVATPKPSRDHDKMPASTFVAKQTRKNKWGKVHPWPALPGHVLGHPHRTAARRPEGTMLFSTQRL